MPALKTELEAEISNAVRQPNDVSDEGVDPNRTVFLLSHGIPSE